MALTAALCEGNCLRKWRYRAPRQLSLFSSEVPAIPKPPATRSCTFLWPFSNYVSSADGLTRSQSQPRSEIVFRRKRVHVRADFRDDRLRRDDTDSIN